MKKINSPGRIHNRGQILIEATIGLAAFLLFIIFIVQVCEETLHETRRARITFKEIYGNQNTRYTRAKKIPTNYHRDIRSVFSNRKSTR